MSELTPQPNDARRRAGELPGAIQGRAPAGAVPPVIRAWPAGRGNQRGPPPIPNWAKPKRSVLSPEELERFGNLLVFARATVEGYFAGKHKSPYRGSSVEFTDYREYVAGDDPKHIDWRAYGRSRRLFVRQYEAETDMVIYFLVDVSRSMDYAGERRESKFCLAAKIAAALAYLTMRQGDKTALALFADHLQRYQPPGGTHRHLHNLVNALEVAQPASGTGMAHALEEADSLFKKRGRLVILSDFWDDTGKILDALSRFLHRKFEVLLLHVFDSHELDLPRAHAALFTDMESGRDVEVQPEEIRAAYREAARQRVDALAREASHRGINYALATSDQPYLRAIEAYLGFRGTNTLSAR